MDINKIIEEMSVKEGDSQETIIEDTNDFLVIFMRIDHPLMQNIVEINYRDSKNPNWTPLGRIYFSKSQIIPGHYTTNPHRLGEYSYAVRSWRTSGSPRLIQVWDKLREPFPDIDYVKEWDRIQGTYQTLRGDR